MDIQGKTVEIYPAQNANAPLVVLNNYVQSGGEIYQKCLQLGCPDFSLAEISGLNWNDDLSPWAIPSVGGNESPFGGKADDYLALLLGSILPAVKAKLNSQPSSVMLSGYSLAGLFALYAATKCDAFRAVASCSGSMWFPKFREYVAGCNASKLPRVIYFSLGDREARTKNQILQTVEDNTLAIKTNLAEKGIKTVFEKNKGNHFQQTALRTAKGIKWMLENAAD